MATSLIVMFLTLPLSSCLCATRISFWMAFPAIHTVATPIASPGAMRRLVPAKQLWTVRGQLEPALQHLLQGGGLQQDQVVFLFRDHHPVDATHYTIQATFDGANPIADGQEVFRPEMIGKDQMPEGAYYLVSARADHFLPLLIVVDQVDQADLLGSPGQDLFTTRTGEV